MEYQQSQNWLLENDNKINNPVEIDLNEEKEKVQIMKKDIYVLQKLLQEITGYTSLGNKFK